ncbi:MAG: hypothetical protein HN586_08355 [Oceanospirillaceae bacterium]|nr:hypothetical protein [Oceanospirillaceae bacterium]
MSNLDLPSQFDTPDNSSAGLDAAVLIVRDALGHQVIAAKSGQTVNFTAVQGQHYRLLSNMGDSEEQLLDNLISVRQGADLIVTYAQGAQVTINGYFDLCVPVTAEQPDDLQCSATVAGDTEAGYVIRGAADSAGVGANSPQIVYTHGEEQELLALVNGNATDEILLTTYLAGIVEPAAAAAFGLPGILGGLGAAGAAAAGGGGSSEGGGTPSAPVANNPGEIAAITGTLKQGETLTAGEIADVDGVLKADGTPVVVTYQWQADGTDIADATAKTYTLTQAQVGKVITVVAIYTDGEGTKETVTSQPTSAVVTVAQAALQSIIDAAETDTAEPLTLDDFIVAGVKNITANGTGETEVGLNSIKSALNSLLVDAEAVDTLGKLQGVVDSYLAILQAADGDTTTEPTIGKADFTNIGVDMRQVKDISHDALVKLLIDVVGGWDNDGVDLVPKLQAIVDAATGVMAGMGEEAEGGKPSVDDLQNLGITDVTADNIFAIRAKFKEFDSAGMDYETLGNLQTVISDTVELYTEALVRIQSISTSPSLEPYYEDRHTERGAKIFAIYETIFGAVVIEALTLIGVEHSDTFDVNDAKFIFRLLLGENTKVGQLNTYVEVQALVDGANAIRGTFNSSTSILPVPIPVPLQEHYEVIGLTGVDTQAEVDLMGDVISKLIDADAEAYGQFELQTLANAVQHVMDAATVDATALTVDNLNLLGISNVDATNFEALKQKIADIGDVNAIDSVAEIQLIVTGLGRSLVRIADTEMGSAISLGSNSEEDALISNFEISDLAVTESATLELNITDLVSLSGDSFDFSDVAKTTGEVYTPEAAYTVSDQTMTSESYDVYLADNKAAELWHNPEIAVVI